MKKLLVAIILMLSALIPSACSCGKDICSITATQDNFSIALNETLDLNDYIVVEGECSFSTSFDGNQITIEDGVVTPITSGTVAIKCEIIGNEDIFTIVNITVRDIYLTTSASVNKKKIIINMGVTSTAINKVEVDSGITEEPQVVYDKSIIGYDYLTGSITARSVGETSVRVIYEKCFVEFFVKVENSVYVEYLSASDVTLYVNDSGKFEIVIMPSNANQYKYYSYSTILGVDSAGNYYAKGNGKATVYVQYLMKNGEKIETKTTTFSVTIYALPDSIDFDFFDQYGNEFGTFFKGETGRIVLKLNEYELVGSYQFSDNIKIVSNGVLTDQYGKPYVLFEANDVGELSIEVSCNILINDVSRKISKTKTINVKDSNMINVVVKHDIYNVEGEGLEYKVGSGRAISIFFMLDNVQLSGVNLYLVENENKSELSNGFVFTDAGRYLIRAEYKGLTIKEIVVVVQ